MSTLAGDTYASSLSFLVQNIDQYERLISEAAMAPGEVARQNEMLMRGSYGAWVTFKAMIDTVLNRLSDEGGITDRLTTGLRRLNSIMTFLANNPGLLRTIGWVVTPERRPCLCWAPL